MSTPKQIIRVSQETFDIIMNSNKHYYQLFADWKAFGGSPLDKAMSELNQVYPNKYVSDVFDMLTRGEAVIFPHEQKKYRIVLPNVHSTGGMYWRYVFIDEHGDIEKCDELKHVKQLTEEQLKELPEKLQTLAEEVND